MTAATVQRAAAAAKRSALALARAAELQKQEWEVTFSKVAVRDKPETKGKRVGVKIK